MGTHTLKVRTLFVVGSPNEIIERLSQDLTLFATRHGGKVIEPDPSAITSYERWCVHLVANGASIEKEKEILAEKYPGVSFVLEESIPTV